MAKRRVKRKARAKGRIKLKPDVKRGSHLPTGKGWRLSRPGGNRALKASLLKTFRAAGERFAIFRVVE